MTNPQKTAVSADSIMKSAKQFILNRQEERRYSSIFVLLSLAVFGVKLASETLFSFSIPHQAFFPKLLTLVLSIATLMLWTLGVGVRSYNALLSMEKNRWREHTVLLFTERFGWRCIIILTILAVVGSLFFWGNNESPAIFSVVAMNIAFALCVYMIADVAMFAFRMVKIHREASTPRRLLLLLAVGAAVLLMQMLGGIFESVQFGAAFLLTIVAVGVVPNGMSKAGWLSLMSKTDKKRLLKSGFVGFFVCGMVFPTVLLLDFGDVTSMLEIVFPGGASALFFSQIVYGAICLRLFIAALFTMPTANAIDKKNRELASLIELNRLAAKNAPLEQILQMATKNAFLSIQADSAWCEVAEPGGQEYIVLSMENIHTDHIAWLHRFPNFVEKIINTSDVTLVENAEENGEFHFLFSAGTSPIARSIISLPLFSGDLRIATLILLKQVSFGFRQEDVGLLHAYSSNIRVAFDNARLVKESIENERIKRELTVAQSVQRSLLPAQHPKIDGVEISAIAIPAFEVGGDYYDFVQLKDGSWCVVVGDVSGKGIPAAFYMAQLKGTVLAASKESLSPLDFLVRINTAMYGAMEKRSYITLLCCQLLPQQNKVVIARAGHCPMLLKQQGNVRVVLSRGIGIGLAGGDFFRNAVEEIAFPYSNNDLIYLYSDGVSERMDASGEEFGVERLIRLIGELDESCSTVEANRKILNMLQDYSGEVPAHDDITSLVLKMTDTSRDIV